MAENVVPTLQELKTIDFCSLAGLVLNEFIQHFEPAHFCLESLRSQIDQQQQLHRTRRQRRSAAAAVTAGEEIHHSRSSHNHYYQLPVQFNFTAHNRLFQVSMVENPQSVFADDVVIENSAGQSVNFDPFSGGKVYSGFLQGT